MSNQEFKSGSAAGQKTKVYLSAITGAVAILVALTAIYYWAQTRTVPPLPEPRLENALRSGDQEFEQNRARLVVEGLSATHSTRPLGDIVMELTATVKNTTGRTLNGLEMRGAVVDAQGAPVGERTVVLVPAQQATLKPDETMNVRVLLEGIKPEAERANLRLEATGLRFE